MAAVTIDFMVKDLCLKIAKAEIKNFAVYKNFVLVKEALISLCLLF